MQCLSIAILAWTMQAPAPTPHPAPSPPATEVERVATALERLASLPQAEWRVGPDPQGLAPEGADPSRPEHDDSTWRLVEAGDEIDAMTCWLRRRVVLPEHVLGEPVAGPALLELGVGGSVEVWVDGEKRERLPGRGSRYELTPNARAGQAFAVAIRATAPAPSWVTTPRLRFQRAEVHLESAAAAGREAEDLALSLRVGEKLLGFDTYQTASRNMRVDPGVDRSTMDRAEKERLGRLLQDLAARVDVEALERGDRTAFRASVERVRPELTPVRDFARRFTLYFTANAHIDAAWLWREAETVHVVKHTFSSVLEIMRQRPELSYAQSSAAYYDWMERFEPDLFEEIRKRVGEGRWEVVGGMWVEPDCNLPGGESWARHLLYASRYFKERLGVGVTLGWNPDSFGYNRSMPMFYRNAGLDAFITQKLSWNETNVFPHRVFWWESPDGSRILTYFPFSYGNTIGNPFGLVDWLRQFEANTGLTKLMVLFGVGDHGGGPSMEMMDRIRRLETLDVYPRVEFGSAGDYVGWLKGHDPGAFPTWTDELYLEYHQGTYTTQASTKERNRRSEVLLTNAEKLSALASLFGRSYPGPRLGEAWRHVLFNQFHDILPGSGIHEIYRDAARRYEEARSLAGFELTGALEHLARNVDTSSAKGTAIVVFNPLSWTRTDVVRLPLPEGDGSDYAVLDGGREIPSQVDAAGPLSRTLFFVAEGVPSFGYRVLSLVKRRPRAAAPAGLTAEATTLESEWFRVTVDAETGWLRSVFDKRADREVLAGPGNELQLLEDTPAQWDAWNVGLTGVRYPTKLRGVEVLERGPVRVSLRVSHDYLKPGVRKGFTAEDFPNSFFTQTVSLYSGLDRIEFTTEADWWEDKTFLKVAFPVSVRDEAATYEIPYGTLRRSTRVGESLADAKVEVPAHRWADLSQDDYGVSLLNRAKHGYDVKENVLRLSLLRSPKWPDPMADRGRHTIEYALYPHAGRALDARTVRSGYEYDNPLIPLLAAPHPGRLPPVHSFVELTPANLVLTTLKRAEDDGAWVLQWYEAAGKDAEARLRLPRTVRKAVLSDFLEADGRVLPSSGRGVAVPTPRHGTVTLKVYLDGGTPFPAGRP